MLLWRFVCWIVGHDRYEWPKHGLWRLILCHRCGAIVEVIDPLHANVRPVKVDDRWNWHDYN
jgi:hypothetical protein